MAKKKEAKKAIPGRQANIVPKVRKEEGQPQKKEQPSEEQLFYNYINQLINVTILEQENVKQKMVDNLKNLGQRLGMYMKEVQRLTKENEELRKKLPKKQG